MMNYILCSLAQFTATTTSYQPPPANTQSGLIYDANTGTYSNGAAAPASQTGAGVTTTIGGQTYQYNPLSGQFDVQNPAPTCTFSNLVFF